MFFALWFVLGAALWGAQPAQAATIIHSNDVLGEIEPCGCRTNPLGGLARKFHFLEKLPDQELIQLDAGDLLFATDVVPPLLAKQARLQASYLLRALDLLHHDAVVPGEKDFALGVKVFDSLRKQSKIHFIAANLKTAKGGRYLEPHVLFTRKGATGKPLRVGVFGIVGTDLTWPATLKATPAEPAARVEVAELKKLGADVIVALTHQGLDADLALAKDVPGIDVIIGGHTQSFLQTPKTVLAKGGATSSPNSRKVTHVYQSSFRDQYVGVIPLTEKINDDDYQLVGLDPSFDSPEGKPSPMDKLVTEFKTEIAKLNEQTDPEALAMTEASSQTQVYQTFPKCAQCHLKQFEFWRKTPHALALGALVEKSQAENKECLGCHTAGLGKPGGFSDVRGLAELKDPETEAVHLLLFEQLHPFLRSIHDAKDLSAPIPWPVPNSSPKPLREALASMDRFYTPVQCENCHGPGGDHPLSSEGFKKVEKTVCLSCHTAERAPGWYTSAGKPDDSVIDTKFQSMKCPAGDLNQ